MGKTFLSNNQGPLASICVDDTAAGSQKEGHVDIFLRVEKLTEYQMTGELTEVFLFSGYGSSTTNPGTCIVEINTRFGKPMMRVTELTPSTHGYGNTDPSFGFYTRDEADSTYFYFGVVRPLYQAKMYIHCLKSTGNIIERFGVIERLEEVPDGWTPATKSFGAWDVPNMHRNIFRGQNLGSTFTDAQKAAIADGTFDNLYIGDYWSINGHTWRIVDIDYWYGQGNPSCTTHHVVVMPDRQLYTHVMNDTNITTGGYALSKMYAEGLEEAKTIATTDFGTNVLNHRIVISNAVANGHQAGYIWTDSTVDLPNEWQMYGAPVFSALNMGNTVPALYTIDQKQFALMQAVPRFISPAYQTVWLRDVVSEACFAAAIADGGARYYNASDVRGVRPAFGVTGD